MSCFKNKKDIYLSGSSINSIGEKTFMIVKITSNSIKEVLLNDVNLIINKESF